MIYFDGTAIRYTNFLKVDWACRYAFISVIFNIVISKNQKRLDSFFLFIMKHIANLIEETTKYWDKKVIFHCIATFCITRRTFSTFFIDKHSTIRRVPFFFSMVRHQFSYFQKQCWLVIFHRDSLLVLLHWSPKVGREANTS